MISSKSMVFSKCSCPFRRSTLITEHLQSIKYLIRGKEEQFRRMTSFTNPVQTIISSRGFSTKSESVKQEEIEKFEKMASSWWDDSLGNMRELHSMNRLRVPFIRDGLLQTTVKNKGIKSNTPKPLEGLRILDVGCGGGILCEPLGRLGATVKGIDPGKENIINAEMHLPDALRDKVSYECINIEEFIVMNPDNFDAVVMSEVIEHVQNPEEFIRSASQILRPGGSLFITTLNRTMGSYIGAIVAWEYLLRKLPVGTHDWKMFLSPEELEKFLKSGGLRTVLVHGMCYNPVSNWWTWTKNRSINYAVHAVKL